MWLTECVVSAWEAATGQSAPRTVERGAKSITPVIALLTEVLALVRYTDHAPVGIFRAWRAALHD